MLRSERGFALTNVLIALVLLSIAVVALSGSSILATALQTDSALRSQVTAIAASYLEEVKARRPATIVSEPPVRVSAAGVVDSAGVFTRSLDVFAEEGLANTKRLTVRVEYPGGRGRAGSVQLVTVMYEGRK